MPASCASRPSAKLAELLNERTRFRPGGFVDVTFVPGRLDYALVVVMLALMLIEVLVFRELGRAAARGAVRNARLRVYAFFITYQWALVACIAALWVATERSWSALLLGSPNRWGFTLCMALAVAYAVLAIAQRRAIMRSPKTLERLRPRVADLESIVPHTPQERRVWVLAAITAGCCEEVFFRGYLLSFAATFTGLVASAVICVVLFGLYHAYYGPKGILKTGAFGLLMTLMALLSESLIPVIIIHAAIDLVSGDLSYLVLSQTPEKTVT
jgi:uncharacterized protein